MSNTSASGGYLAPISTAAPLEDDALDAVFQQMIVGVTGLPGNMVRPRWQPVDPKQPEPSVNWCAFGIIDVRPDDNAAIEHDGAISVDNYARHEDFELLVTFYGPARNSNAQLLRDGLAMSQNREALKINLISFISSATMRSIPELVNLQWIKRCDLPLYFRRKIERQYAVLNVGSASGVLTADASQQPITSTFSA